MARGRGKTLRGRRDTVAGVLLRGRGSFREDDQQQGWSDERPTHLLPSSRRKSVHPIIIRTGQNIAHILPYRGEYSARVHNADLSRSTEICLTSQSYHVPVCVAFGVHCCVLVDNISNTRRIIVIHKDNHSRLTYRHDRAVQCGHDEHE
jgi:hypothetical protein